jgi:hypothetical protein
MLSVDIFLPPLLGGFLLVALWYRLRYWSHREQGYKIVFAAAIAGGFLLIVAATLVALITSIPTVGPWLRSTWHAAMPVPHSGKAAIAFFLGPLLAWLLNGITEERRRVNKKRIVDDYVVRKNDPLEMRLRHAMGSGQLLAVTLKTNKVYIGRVATNLNPGSSVESISISLVQSGYREMPTHKMILNVNYADTHAQIYSQVYSQYSETIDRLLSQREREASSETELTSDALDEIARAILEEADIQVSALSLHEQFETVIFVREIIFDPELFLHFQREKNELVGDLQGVFSFT